MATRERYARVWTRFKGREVSIGVEALEQGYAMEAIQDQLEVMAMEAMVNHALDSAVEAMIEGRIRQRWPGRAFFIEIDDGPEESRRGVQIFQPWGLPKGNTGIKDVP